VAGASAAMIGYGGPADRNRRAGRTGMAPRSGAPVRDRIPAEANFSVFEQLGGHLLAGHAQAIHFQAFGTIHDNSIEEVVCQFLLGKSSPHFTPPNLSVKLKHWPRHHGGGIISRDDQGVEWLGRLVCKENFARDSRLRGVIRHFKLKYQAMEERDFFDESEVFKPANLSCSFCRRPDIYDIRWILRAKKKVLKGPADERDRARFVKAQSYMLRRDDFVQCKNPRCRKRFEISGLQSVAFL